jgi:hypothetical protein
MQSIRQAFINLLETENTTIDLIPLFKQYPRRIGSIEMIEILDNFQKSGDTILTAYLTKCGSDTCSNRQDSKYFTLVGNNSKNYALLQLASLPEQAVKIRFCNNIIPTTEVELNDLNEIYVAPGQDPF